MNYINLHTHTHYSPMDSITTPAEYFARCKELGMTHCSITDHGTNGGHREAQIAAEETGILPILGQEMYYTNDRFDKRSKAKRQDGTNVYKHLIVIAKDDAGLSNLNQMNSRAWTEGFYNKPRIDDELLNEYNDGLIVLSACMGGELAGHIENGEMEEALLAAKRMQAVFGQDYYIELQPHNPVDINKGLLHIADTLGIKPVMTSDCHYVKAEDLWIEDAMLILSTSPKRENWDTPPKGMDFMEKYNYLYPDRKMTFQEYKVYLRTYEDHVAMMKANGFDRLDLYENTYEVADKIGTYALHRDLDLLPRPKNQDSHEALVKKVRAGLKRLKLTDQEYVDRAEHELDVIKQKDFSTYFLIVENMMAWSKEQGIRTGPGRGSAAGSLVCYALGITDVDPIKYGLIFERFVDVHRADKVDVDTDFQASRRKEVLKYLERKFKHVARVGIFTPFKDKQVVKDAGKALGVPLADTNKVTKQFLNYDDFLVSPNTKEFRDKYPDVVALATELRGRIKSVGMHASGVVISKDPWSKYVPIETAKDPNDKSGGRLPVIPLDMDAINDLGADKLDVLGLKDLDVIEDALKMVRERHGIDVEEQSRGLDDKGVYEMLSEGYTRGIAQASGHAFTKWIVENGVYEFNDLVIGTSIARPGPADTIGPLFTAIRKGKAKVKSIHPAFDEHLEETSQLHVYQEQWMKTMVAMGMSMKDAAALRRLVGKKKSKEEFDKYKGLFIKHAVTLVSEKKAEEMWEDFEKFGGYAFAKAHAVPYSMITYQSAWLKRYYPAEFICAALIHEGEKDTVTELLIEAKRLGVRVLLPHVNESDANFMLDPDGNLRFGLSSIKYISEMLAERLIARRPFHTYTHLAEVVGEKNNGMNARMLSAMNAIGAANFVDNPYHGKEKDNLYEYLNIPSFSHGAIPEKVMVQFTPLDEYSDKGSFVIYVMVSKLIIKDGWARIDVLDATGKAGIFINPDTGIEAGQMYAILVSNNSVARYATMDEVINKERTVFVEYLYRREFPDVPEGQSKVISFNTRKTRAGKLMADAVISTADKELTSVLVFPQMYHKAYGSMKDGAVVAIELNQLKDGGYCVGDIL